MFLQDAALYYSHLCYCSITYPLLYNFTVTLKPKTKIKKKLAVVFLDVGVKSSTRISNDWTFLWRFSETLSVKILLWIVLGWTETLSAKILLRKVLGWTETLSVKILLWKVLGWTETLSAKILLWIVLGWTETLSVKILLWKVLGWTETLSVKILLWKVLGWTESSDTFS